MPAAARNDAGYGSGRPARGKWRTRVPRQITVVLTIRLGRVQCPRKSMRRLSPQDGRRDQRDASARLHDSQIPHPHRPSIVQDAISRSRLLVIFRPGKLPIPIRPRDDNPDEAPKNRVGIYGEETFDDDDEDFDYDDDDFGDDMSTEWNLRKCAAAALDVLAVRFSGDLLNVLLGPLKDKLWSTDWLQRESGILALGAMAEGCIDAIEPHLPTLVPYLINTLNDSKVDFFWLSF